MPASSMRPIPEPSTPMLLLIVCSPLTPLRIKAATRFSGIPQRPKPPSMRVAPSGISATASSAVAIILFSNTSDDNPSDDNPESAIRRTRSRNRQGGFRTRLPSKLGRYLQPHRGQFFKIDSGFDAHAVQHVQHVLSRDVSRGPWGVRTPAQTGNRAVQ